MCVIIDADVAGRTFAVPCEDDFAPLWKWIEERDGKLVFGLGGTFGKELRKMPNVKRRVLELWRAGLAVQAAAKELSKREKELDRLNICRSNDVHVLALALVSGTRILCGKDGDLATDFRNPDIISSPRGKVYKNASHKHLLKYNHKCKCSPKLTRA